MTREILEAITFSSEKPIDISHGCMRVANVAAQLLGLGFGAIALVAALSACAADWNKAAPPSAEYPCGPTGVVCATSTCCPQDSVCTSDGACEFVGNGDFGGTRTSQKPQRSR